MTVRRRDAPPVVGAALHGLDRLGVDDAAKERLRRELDCRGRPGDGSRESARAALEAGRG